jgi:predicted  nucleic acid-binding Zn-ribbon protein
MIEISSVKQSLLELADKIYGYDAGAAVRLRLLADAVDGGKGAEAWASVDIYRMIDPDSIVERFSGRQRGSGLLGVVEIVRNTFIFGPIIVTWFGISQATEKYNDLLTSSLKSHPDQVSQPFLYLWQQGFGGRLAPYLTLSNLALIDASILAFIFILTFLAFSLSQASESRSSKAASELRSELVHALTGAALCLQANRYQPQLTAGDNLEVVARQINTMAREVTSKFDGMIQQVLSQFAAMIKQAGEQQALSLKQSNDQFSAMANGMLKQFDTMSGGILKQFDTTASDILKQFDVMARKLGDQVQEGNKYLSKLTSFVSGLDQLSKELQTAAQTLQTSNAELAAGMNALIAPAREVADQQKVLAASVKDSAGLLQQVTQTLVDLSRKQDRWSADLSDVLDALNLSVEKEALFVTSMGSLTAQQTSFLEQLEKERDAQYDLATRMSDSTVTLGEALAAMQDGSISLRSAAHDMNDILNLQKATDTRRILEDYTNAAQLIERSGKSLNAAAIAIYDAGQRLTDIIDQLQDRLAARK